MKRSSLSMRTTMLLWLVIPLICLCTLSATFANRLAEEFANAAYDTLLLNSADSIVARLSRNEKGIVVADLPLAAQEILRHNGYDRFYYQILDSRGRRLTGDSFLPLPVNINRSGPSFRNAFLDGHAVRMCRVPVQLNPSTDTIWVQVAETTNSRQRLLHLIFLSIVVPQVALVALGCLSVWIGVSHGLQPLHRLGNILKARTKIDLSPVDIGKTPSELMPVLEALNLLFNGANKHMRSQQEFIGDAAHQLRTPITALKTYVDHLQRIDVGADVASVLNQLSEASNRLMHMTNRLLSLARAERTEQRPQQFVDLKVTIDDAAAAVVHEALDKDVDMQFDLPDAPLIVGVDRQDLLELLTNLLENAIRYSRANGLIWVRVLKTDSLVLVVEDNGPGIPDEEKPRVFDRFYRILGSKKSGCGLGLSIVKEIATRHNATIELTDRPGGGACFTIAFPLVDRTPAKDEMLPALQSSSAS